RLFRRRGLITSVAGVAFLVFVGVVANQFGESPRLIDVIEATTSVAEVTEPTTIAETASTDVAATVSSTTLSPSTASSLSPSGSVTASSIAKKSTKATTTTAAPPVTVVVDSVPVSSVLVATTVVTTPATTTIAPIVTPTVAPTTTLSSKSIVTLATCKDLSKGGAGITLGVNVTDIDGVKSVVAGRYKSTLNSPTSVAGSVYNFYVLKGSSTVVEPFVVEVRVTDTKGNMTTAYLELTSKNCA
ncbi:MAG: hypothetical protein RJB08_1480, partial [Actinomycetota bacterium]